MSFLQKTFGGLTRAFYWRQFFFGLFIYGLCLYLISLGKQPFWDKVGIVAVFTLMQFLYPYARFVYHSITDFLLGNNVYFFNAFFLLLFRGLMAVLCWYFSPLIAPLGLAYLYFYHSKKEKENSDF